MPARAELVRPARHHFGVGVMQRFVRFVLEGATSLRAASRVLGVLGDESPDVEEVPVANTGQWWLLRLGLYELRRPKERATDWVLLLDHTIQMGQVKCLLIVGFRLSEWEAQGRGPLDHRDLSVMALEPMRQSTAEAVEAELDVVTAQIGPAAAIVSDQGTELKKAIINYQQRHPATIRVSDIKHKMALLMKAQLEADERWPAFVAQVGRTKAHVQQTELAHLTPPSLKEKARYMNLDTLVHWGQRVLQHLDTPAAARRPAVESRRLEAKLGWLREYREASGQWDAMLGVVEETLNVVREDGYHRQAGKVLRKRLKGLTRDASSQRVAEQAVSFVAEQSAAADRRHLPGSTECLESLIGKGKRLEGQQSRSGFTKMVLAMAAAVAEPTVQTVRAALEAVKTREVIAWQKEKLGPSVQAQRRQALALPPAE